MVAKQCQTSADAAAAEAADAEGGGKGGGKKKEERTTQFITTTFRPELIGTAHKCFGVTHARKASTVKECTPAEALRFIQEAANRQRQHIGVS